ncbi:hypothetical protein SLA2020_265930 [Shorea laevis]
MGTMTYYVGEVRLPGNLQYAVLIIWKKRKLSDSEVKVQEGPKAAEFGQLYGNSIFRTLSKCSFGGPAMTLFQQG